MRTPGWMTPALAEMTAEEDMIFSCQKPIISPSQSPLKG